MNNLAKLLGSSTRANVVQALAMTEKPLSAYRVSKMYSSNISKVYIEMKKLAGLGLISVVKGRRGLEYALIDTNLRALALKLSPRSITYDEWCTPEGKARRFRNGLIKVPKFSLGERSRSVSVSRPTRMKGELSTLAILARSKFDKKYRRIGDREYARI